MATNGPRHGLFLNRMMDSSASKDFSTLRNPAAGLHTPAVRDLAWACFAPPLLITPLLKDVPAGAGNCHLTLTAARRDWLRRLDRSPGPLLAFIRARGQRRLGLYFEALWQFFLTRDSDTDLIAHNLPVRQGGTTRGEFDLLYYCHREKRHFHLELAVKFYLAAGARAAVPDECEWLGPDTRDRLDLKLARLTGHQSRLGESPAGRQALLTHLGTDDISTEIEVKGQLFIPAGTPPQMPRSHNTAVPPSLWLRLSELPVTLSNKSRYLILSRLRWLAPAQPEVNETTLGRDTMHACLKKHLLAGGRPALAAALDDTGRELHRFFIVPDSWPSAPDSCAGGNR